MAHIFIISIKVLFNCTASYKEILMRFALIFKKLLFREGDMCIHFHCSALVIKIHSSEKIKHDINHFLM